MQNGALVSVIMCVYNTPEEYLVCAVQSILNQTYTNFELLIVDDCSSLDLFSNNIFSDKRIKILRNDTNKGPSYSRNRALDMAKGRYVAIMDSDDMSFPSRFEKQVTFLDQNKNIVACGTWFEFFGDKAHMVKRTFDDFDYYRCCLLFSNEPTLLNPSVMIKKSALIDNKIKWNENLRIGEDYMMWVQLSEIGIITNYPEVLLKYRSHNKQASVSEYREKYSANAWEVNRYQLLKLGLDLNIETINLLGKRTVKSIKELKKTSCLLSNIESANQSKLYFNQDKLIFRCNEQIERLVFSIKNPFKLFALLFSKYRIYAKKVISHRLKKPFKKKG